MRERCATCNKTEVFAGCYISVQARHTPSEKITGAEVEDSIISKRRCSSCSLLVRAAWEPSGENFEAVNLADTLLGGVASRVAAVYCAVLVVEFF